MQFHVADVVHAGEIHHHPLEAQAIACVTAGAVAPQVAVILVILRIHAQLLDAGFQHIQTLLALATADEITEISHHQRGMIQLLRAAKPDSIPLDYPQLAVDLYGLQCDAPQLAQLPANIRLRWGQDLYRYEKNESSETQKKEN